MSRHKRILCQSFDTIMSVFMVCFLAYCFVEQQLNGIVFGYSKTPWIIMFLIGLYLPIIALLAGIEINKLIKEVRIDCVQTRN